MSQVTPPLSTSKNSKYSAINKFASEFRPALEATLVRRRYAAFAEEGPTTFGSTRRTAAVHEAGHAVVFEATASDLFPRPRDVQIYQDHSFSSEFGDVWLGHTSEHPGYKRAAKDFQNIYAHHLCALRTYAGLAAEILFNPADFRLGSSLDEDVATNVYALNIALNLNESPTTVLDAIKKNTDAVLKANEDTLLSIAGFLEDNLAMDGSELREALRGIARAEQAASLLMETSI